MRQVWLLLLMLATVDVASGWKQRFQQRRNVPRSGFGNRARRFNNQNQRRINKHVVRPPPVFQSMYGQSHIFGDVATEGTSQQQLSGGNRVNYGGKRARQFRGHGKIQQSVNGQVPSRRRQKKQSGVDSFGGQRQSFSGFRQSRGRKFQSNEDGQSHSRPRTQGNTYGQVNNQQLSNQYRQRERFLEQSHDGQRQQVNRYITSQVRPGPQQANNYGVQRQYRQPHDGQLQFQTVAYGSSPGGKDNVPKESGDVYKQRIVTGQNMNANGFEAFRDIQRQRPSRSQGQSSGGHGHVQKDQSGFYRQSNAGIDQGFGYEQRRLNGYGAHQDRQRDDRSYDGESQLSIRSFGSQSQQLGGNGNHPGGERPQLGKNGQSQTEQIDNVNIQQSGGYRQSVRTPNSPMDEREQLQSDKTYPNEDDLSEDRQRQQFRGYGETLNQPSEGYNRNRIRQLAPHEQSQGGEMPKSDTYGGAANVKRRHSGDGRQTEWGNVPSKVGYPPSSDYSSSKYPVGNGRFQEEADSSGQFNRFENQIDDEYEQPRTTSQTSSRHGDGRNNDPVEGYRQNGDVKRQRLAEHAALPTETETQDYSERDRTEPLNRHDQNPDRQRNEHITGGDDQPPDGHKRTGRVEVAFPEPNYSSQWQPVLVDKVEKQSGSAQSGTVNWKLQTETKGDLEDSADGYLQQHRRDDGQSFVTNEMDSNERNVRENYNEEYSSDKYSRVLPSQVSGANVERTKEGHPGAGTGDRQDYDQMDDRQSVGYPNQESAQLSSGNPIDEPPSMYRQTATGTRLQRITSDDGMKAFAEPISTSVDVGRQSRNDSRQKTEIYRSRDDGDTEQKIEEHSASSSNVDEADDGIAAKAVGGNVNTDGRSHGNEQEMTAVPETEYYVIYETIKFDQIADQVYEKNDGKV